MNKLKFIGILLIGVALVFTGCDALIEGLSSTRLAEQEAAETAAYEAVAGIESIVASTYFDRDGDFLGVDTPEDFTLSFDAEDGDNDGTFYTDAIAVVAGQWSDAFTTATLTVTTINESTVDYVAGATFDLLTGGTITVTSVDGKVSHTYDVVANVVTAPAALAIIGNAAGSWDNDKFTLVTEASGGVYSGLTYLTAGECKLRTPNSWAVNVGTDGAAVANVYPMAPDGDNIVIATAGFYYIRASYVDMTLAVIPVAATGIGVIGSATAGGWDADTNLTGDTTTDVFTGTITFADGEWKFRMNDAWDYNWGSGAVAGIGYYSGGNLPEPGIGSYTVTFNGRTFAYTTVAN